MHVYTQEYWGSLRCDPSLETEHYGSTERMGARERVRDLELCKTLHTLACMRTLIAADSWVSVLSVTTFETLKCHKWLQIERGDGDEMEGWGRKIERGWGLLLWLHLTLLSNTLHFSLKHLFKHCGVQMLLFFCIANACLFETSELPYIKSTFGNIEHESLVIAFVF